MKFQVEVTKIEGGFKVVITLDGGGTIEAYASTAKQLPTRVRNLTAPLLEDLS